ncbi:MAG: histidine--tRNA ligase [Porticoccaceae bacterium]|nr:histidine--tRNA ligase [Porticoccaceae bacterium]
MVTSTRSVKGMNDLLPADSSKWQRVEQSLKSVLNSYGYSEIRFPILEKTELFRRSIGEVTDIVEKEMYTFPDRNDENLTLRPEGTAGCVRACIQNSLLNSGPLRLWYNGPMFRYERPQKGRMRQFHQFGVECFGMTGPDIDAEVIAMTAAFWRALGVAEAVTLEINSLGTSASRQAHKKALIEYFETHKSVLDEDSQRRLDTNPLRILDTKNPEMQDLVESAPKLSEYMDEESRIHFEGLCQLLDQLDISYRVNHRLVRGLDYYSKTVFEWVTDALGAQGTVCGGGRYDGLIPQLGGPETPALGFGLGVERLMLLVEEINPGFLQQQAVDIFVIASDQEVTQALQLAEKIRIAEPRLSVVVNCGGGSFKSQFKKADRSGAELALILGEDEVRESRVTLKYLREKKDQESLTLDEALNRLRSL